MGSIDAGDHPDTTQARSSWHWATHPVTLISLCLLVPVVLALAFWLYENMQLQAELSELRAQGMPTSGEELNAYYVVPAGETDTTQAWIDALNATDIVTRSPEAKDLPFIGMYSSPLPRRGEAWGDLDRARKFLEDHRAELKLIHDAAAMGGQVRFPVDFTPGLATLLPNTGHMRSLARILSLDAYVADHDGDSARALQDVRAMLTLFVVTRNEPTTISQLVRYAILAVGTSNVERLMPEGNWNDAELASLQELVCSSHIQQEFANSVIGERALSQTSIEMVPVTPLQLYLKQRSLHHFEESLKGLSGGWQKALDREHELEKEFNELLINRIAPLGMMYRDLLAPPHSQYIVAGMRAEARQRCLNLAIAAQRYHLKHGHYPAMPEEIDPEWIGLPSDRMKLLMDPFDGARLRYKLEEDRLIIYSIGEDYTDDGGNCDSESATRTTDTGMILRPPLSPLSGTSQNMEKLHPRKENESHD